MRSRKKRFSRVISITMACALLFAGGCADSKDHTPSETKQQIQASKPDKTVEPMESAPILPENAPESTVDDPQKNDDLSDEAYGRLEMEFEERNRKNLWITVQDITENGKLIDRVENDDGVRSDTYVYDDIIRVAIERVEGAEYGAASVIARTAEWENLPESEIDAQEDALDSYPAFRLAYEKNGNWCLDLYVQTDSWDFRIHTEMPIDIPGMDEDQEYAYVEQTVIHWLYTAKIVSIESGD